ncbi:MAG: glycosyltransferase [Saprospiraceae bacterium]
MKQSLHIIIPCYNPSQPDWARTISTAFRQLEEQLDSIDLGLVLVNDGSVKGIQEKDFEFLRSSIPNCKIISYTENRGKGYALRQGVAQSDADFYVFTDVDFPYEERSMVELITALLSKKGIAAGTRNQEYYLKVPLPRQILSKLFRVFIRLLGIPVNDTQCGLKGFDNEGKKIFLQTETDRYLFDFEFLVLAARAKSLKIYSVPVKLKEGIVFTKMGWNVIRAESVNFLRILFRVS